MNNGCWLRRNVTHVVYRCWSAGGTLLYIGATNSLAQRKCHHRRRSLWWPQVATVATEPHPNRAAAHEAEQSAIRVERPVHNKERYGGSPPDTEGVSR